LKSDLSIQKEKLRIAKNRQEQEPAVTQQTIQAPQQQAPQQVQPSDSALAWKSRNNWYNQPEHKEESDYAMYQHYVLENEGYIADTDDYWNELDTRVRKVFPNLEGSEKTAEKNDAKPTVQRVASTSVGSRQKTQAKKGGVTFTKSEQARLRALKPHKMSEDEWFKRVAKEKQKISQQREVS